MGAACGKDPGFSPSAILEQAARSSRYTDEEISSLAFEGPAPRAADLSRRWHEALGDGRRVVTMLPAVHAGEAVLTTGGELFTKAESDLVRALANHELQFHPGRLSGTWPRVKGQRSSDAPGECARPLREAATARTVAA